MNLLPVLKVILKDDVLPLGGDHGFAHWARVLGNGWRLTDKSGANLPVVSLFVVLHNSRRVKEISDADHGPLTALFAAKLMGHVAHLDNNEFQLLYRTCEGHTNELTHPDVTIRTCWNVDRLDLGRVSITPHPSRLCPDVAKRPETIKGADGRARFRVVPQIILDGWEVDLAKGRTW